MILNQISWTQYSLEVSEVNENECKIETYVSIDSCSDKRRLLATRCYCDDPPTTNDPEFQKLMAVSKLDDNESIKEILAKKEWARF